MHPPDPHDVLEVGPHASRAEIRKAYRRLARACHPDHNPGDPTAEERFKAVTEAYEILTGRTRARGTGPGPAPRSSDRGSAASAADDDFDDPFLRILHLFREYHPKSAGAATAKTGRHDPD